MGAANSFRRWLRKFSGKSRLIEADVFARLAARARSRSTHGETRARVIGSGRARTIRVRPILYMRWACVRGEGHARTTRQRVRARGTRGTNERRSAWGGRLTRRVNGKCTRERRRVAARAFGAGTHEVRQQGPHSQEGREVLDDRHGDDARAGLRLRARDSAGCEAFRTGKQSHVDGDCVFGVESNATENSLVLRNPAPRLFDDATTLVRSLRATRSEPSGRDPRAELEERTRCGPRGLPSEPSRARERDREGGEREPNPRRSAIGTSRRTVLRRRPTRSGGGARERSCPPAFGTWPSPRRHLRVRGTCRRRPCRRVGSGPRRPRRRRPTRWRPIERARSRPRRLPPVTNPA